MKKPEFKKPPIVLAAVIAIVVVGGIMFAMRPAQYVYEVPPPPMPSGYVLPSQTDLAAADQQRNGHERRVPMNKYWDRTHIDYAIAKAALAQALVALEDGQTVEASQLADKAKQYAFAGANDVAKDVPEGWGEVESHLSNSLAGMADLAGKFGDSIESDHPISAKKAALEANAYQQAELDQADHLARELYSAAGGNPHDLSGGG